MLKCEIGSALAEGMGLCGIDIHNLGHRDGKQSCKGSNPSEIVLDGVCSAPKTTSRITLRGARESGRGRRSALQDPSGSRVPEPASHRSWRYASVAFGILMTEELSPNVVRHLEMIQDVIRRMADNSFTVRRWSIGAAGALIGAAVVTDEPMIAFVGAVMAMVFWTLDAYYLRQERWFRSLYDKVRAEPDAAEAFAMATRWPPTRRASFPANFFSLTEWLSHLPLVLAAVAVGLVLALGG